MYGFIGKWHDLIAGVVSTIALIVAGIYLAFHYQPVWLNRAGSLIVIIGILLAVNRVHKIFENRFIEMFDKDGDKVLSDIIELTEKRVDKPLTAAQVANLKGLARIALVRQLPAVTTERKHIFGYFEVWLVIIGTFLKGFGDYLVCLFKSCGT